MFIVSKKHSDNFEMIELREIASGTVAVVIPAYGATLHSFYVNTNNTVINAIDFYETAQDFSANVESKGFKSCKLSPFACRMKDASYDYNSEHYTIQKFILNGSALHGLLYDAPFTIIDEKAGPDEATVTLLHRYKATDSGFPFFYDCTVTYRLKKNNELVITTSITNNHTAAIPMQDGWHPYFTFGESINDLLLEFQSAEHVLFNEQLLPTGETEAYDDYAALKKIDSAFFDDCFLLNFKTCQPMCVLRDAAKKIQLEIRPDESYPYLQLYTPPHRKSIAIENLSAPPDAFNNGKNLLHVAPGASANFTTSYKITTLK